MWQSSKAHPAAYCPPGSICGMLSIPRALPPVTQSSALQAPERMWRPIRGRKRIQRTGRFILVYRLAIDAEPRKGDGVAD